MDTVVISVGGSVLVPDSSDTTYITELAGMLKELSHSYKLYIVVGGGRIARYYIGIGRSLGADESYLDDLGINVTRLNARLLITALGRHAYHVPALSFDEALQAAADHKIVVMGGTHPGHTTDAVSAMLAERAGAARLINATNVDGAYTSDPREDPEAALIPKMTYQELISLVNESAPGAGPNTVFDPLGARIIARSGIPTTIVNGRKLDTLRKAIEGELEGEGTLISV